MDSAKPTPAPQNTAASFKALQADVRAALEKSLGEKIVSHSPHQMTGNAYQAVRFGDDVKRGFRKSRPNLFAGFEIAGKSVCDLGANLGEISRDLRRAGARHVDAYEYDEFFTQQARYISAYNGLHDINHIQADVSQPGFMRDDYDICVGLSCFSYMKKSVDYICQRTRQQIILETHEIRDANWPGTYVAPIRAYFPHWCVFGVVPHGTRDSGKRRLWLAFGKKSLRSMYRRRAFAVTPGEDGVVEFDLSRSRVVKLLTMEPTLRDGGDPLSPANINRHLERLTELDREYVQGAYVNLSMSGEAYWKALLCGLAEFGKQGELTKDNIYLTWVRRGIGSGKIDPDLKPLLDDERAFVERMSFRVRTLSEALRTRDPGVFGEVPIVWNATPHHANLEPLYFKMMHRVDTNEDLCVPLMDGHHRVFIMGLLGIEKCPMMMIWDPSYLTMLPQIAKVPNYEARMYQYIAGQAVDDPVWRADPDPAKQAPSAPVAAS